MAVRRVLRLVERRTLGAPNVTGRPDAGTDGGRRAPMVRAPDVDALRDCGTLVARRDCAPMAGADGTKESTSP